VIARKVNSIYIKVHVSFCKKFRYAKYMYSCGTIKHCLNKQDNKPGIPKVCFRRKGCKLCTFSYLFVFFVADICYITSCIINLTKTCDIRCQTCRFGDISTRHCSHNAFSTDIRLYIRRLHAGDIDNVKHINARTSLKCCSFSRLCIIFT